MIVIDTETTGVNPAKHSIVSIGALEFENPKNEFYGECKVWDGASIMKEALAMNGFTENDIRDPSKQSLEVLMIAFLSWVKEIKDKGGETTLAGHNLGDLDLSFLIDSARRYHLNFFLAHRVIDTHSLTYFHLVKRGREVPVDKGRSDINSHFIQDYVGIPHETDPHNAISGAKWEAEAISRLLYDKSLLGEYNTFPIPWLEK